MYNNSGMSKIQWSSPSPVYLFNYQIRPCSFAAFYITPEAVPCPLKVCQRMRHANEQNPHLRSQPILVRMTVYLRAIVRIFTFLCYPIFRT